MWLILPQNQGGGFADGNRRDESIETLAEEFGDVVKGSAIKKTRALQDEQNEPDLWNKPRIVFNYDQKSPSRMIEMVHHINELGAEG